MQMQVMGSKTWGRVPCLQEPQQGPPPTLGERWPAGPCKSTGYSENSPLRSQMLDVRGAPPHRDGWTAALATNDGRL